MRLPQRKNCRELPCAKSATRYVGRLMSVARRTIVGQAGLAASLSVLVVAACDVYNQNLLAGAQAEWGAVERGGRDGSGGADGATGGMEGGADATGGDASSTGGDSMPGGGSSGSGGS